jgi:hypothetical protein
MKLLPKKLFKKIKQKAIIAGVTASLIAGSAGIQKYFQVKHPEEYYRKKNQIIQKHPSTKSIINSGEKIGNLGVKGYRIIRDKHIRAKPIKEIEMKRTVIKKNQPHLLKNANEFHFFHTPLSKEIVNQRLTQYKSIWNTASRTQKKTIMKAWAVDCARFYEINPQIFLSLLYEESKFINRKAKTRSRYNAEGKIVGKNKGVRAIGIGQIMPYTFREQIIKEKRMIFNQITGKNIQQELMDEFINIEVTAALIARNQKRFNSTKWSIAAYRDGVTGALRQKNAGKKTTDYVQKIESHQNRYAHLNENPDFYYSQLFQ